jgi:hypothetical protein
MQAALEHVWAPGVRGASRRLCSPPPPRDQSLLQPGLARPAHRQQLPDSYVGLDNRSAGQSDHSPRLPSGLVVQRLGWRLPSRDAIMWQMTCGFIGSLSNGYYAKLSVRMGYVSLRPVGRLSQAISRKASTWLDRRDIPPPGYALRRTPSIMRGSLLSGFRACGNSSTGMSW